MHKCVHCEGGGCTACGRTGVCSVPADLFEDTGRRIKNLASKMDIILFGVKTKRKDDLKDLIEDVLVLQCFHIAAYGDPSPILEKFVTSLADENRQEKKQERKDSGSIFTPPYIADYIVRSVVGVQIEKIRKDKRIKDKIRKILTLRICDPCVGGGIFLVCAHDLIMREILAVDPNADMEELSGRAAKCLFGVDINPDAVEGCKLALQLNIAKWRLKKQIEEFASSAQPPSSSLSANGDKLEKPSSVQGPAPGDTSTQKTTRTNVKKRPAKHARPRSQSRTGTERSDSAPSGARRRAGSLAQGSI